MSCYELRVNAATVVKVTSPTISLLFLALPLAAAATREPLPHSS